MSQPLHPDDAHTIPRAVLVEMAAAVVLARLHRATLDLELAGDAEGNLRLRLKGIRGVSCQALVEFDRESTIGAT